MGYSTVETFDKIEKKIVCSLLLRSSIIDDIGLLEGKMGIIISFLHYYRITNNKLYDEVADELMDEVADGINVCLNIGLRNGLSGVGWGIEYIIQNRFVEGIAVDVCSQIDRKIMDFNFSRMNDFTLDLGLCGLFHYVLAHIKGCQLQKTEIPFTSDFLSEIFKCAISITGNNDLNMDIKDLANIYIRYYLKNGDVKYEMNVSPFVDKKIKLLKNSLNLQSIGLKNGLAGALLQIKNVV